MKLKKIDLFAQNIAKHAFNFDHETFCKFGSKKGSLVKKAGFGRSSCKKIPREVLLAKKIDHRDH